MTCFYTFTPHLPPLQMSTQQQQQQADEENNDPFLELEPQTLFHHQHSNSNSHNTRRINEIDIDPSLHEDQRSSRLTDFASHILGSQDGDHHDHEEEHGHGDHGHGHGHGELSFTGENGVLESSNHPFHAIDEEVDEGEFEPHLEEGHEEEEGEGEFVGESQTPGPSHVALLGQTQRVGRKRGAYGKRKRTGEDEVVNKKQNHVCLPFSPLPISLYPLLPSQRKGT
jgi:hypothetical protein